MRYSGVKILNNNSYPRSTFIMIPRLIRLKVICVIFLFCFSKLAFTQDLHFSNETWTSNIVGNSFDGKNVIATIASANQEGDYMLVVYARPDNGNGVRDPQIMLFRESREINWFRVKSIFLVVDEGNVYHVKHDILESTIFFRYGHLLKDKEFDKSSFISVGDILGMLKAGETLEIRITEIRNQGIVENIDLVFSLSNAESTIDKVIEDTGESYFQDDDLVIAKGESWRIQIENNWGENDPRIYFGLINFYFPIHEIHDFENAMLLYQTSFGEIEGTKSLRFYDPENIYNDLPAIPVNVIEGITNILFHYRDDLSIPLNEKLEDLLLVLSYTKKWSKNELAKDISLDMNELREPALLRRNLSTFIGIYEDFLEPQDKELYPSLENLVQWFEN